jgi:3-methyladenine DNA glycosylase AlkD
MSTRRKPSFHVNNTNNTNSTSSTIHKKRTNYAHQNKIDYTDLIQRLSSDIQDNAIPSKAIPMKAYMKNQFEFIGLPCPERNKLYTNFRKNCYKPQCDQELVEWVGILWAQPYREYKGIAMTELALSRKLISPYVIEDIEKLLVLDSWWDTIDFLASNIFGGYYLGRPNELKLKIDEWSKSNNMWLNRTAILVQLKYKTATDLSLLHSAIVPHLKSSEFFHQKAIGWALRELAKTNPQWVRDYVSANPLKPLSVREALKHIK